MEKIVTKKISIWEKVSAFEELADVGWMMYFWGISGALILFLLSLLIINIENRK